MALFNTYLPSRESVTVFQTVLIQFPTANHTGKIKTQEFLDASAGLVQLVDKFGKSFSPVVYDMNGNIRKITSKFNENKENYEFIEDMILKQKGCGDLVAVESLQWLRRALHLFTRFFQLIISDCDCKNNTQDLSVFLKNAYRETLERYHGWLGCQLFNILSRFVPNKRDFFYILAMEQHNNEDIIVNDMRVFTQNLSLCVQKLAEFYHEHELETHYRV